MPRSFASFIRDPLVAIFAALVSLPPIYLLIDDRRYFEGSAVVLLVWLAAILITNHRKSNETQAEPEPVAAPPASERETELTDEPHAKPVSDSPPPGPVDRQMEAIRVRLQALELPSEMEELLNSYFRLIVKTHLNLTALMPSVEIAATKCEAVQQQVLSVEKIALETKLLALNDAFDAAASGESGRGFGMVAKEVGRVSHSASRVSEAIELEMSAISSTAKQLASELSQVSVHALAHSYQDDTELRGWIHQTESACKKLKLQLSRAVALLSEDRQSSGTFTQNRTDPVVGTVVSQLQEDITAMLEALESINADMLALHLHPLRLLPDVGRLKTIVDAVVEECGLE
ncbi:MAG TPA: methyl-accepting chemotaxis protein [Pseudomonadales bacterium]|nr:methyl-accepting chemotaxis protein [Pseudomonadales bacterium]